MEYQLVLSPKLEMNPADFVAAWNDDPDAHAAAEARLSDASSKSLGDITAMSLAIDFVLGVTSGMTASGLYDLIKQVIQKQGVHKRTRYMEVTKPDGTHIIVLDSDE
jgi:hypothetical protein